MKSLSISEHGWFDGLSIDNTLWIVDSKYIYVYLSLTIFM